NRSAARTRSATPTPSRSERPCAPRRPRARPPRPENRARRTRRALRTQEAGSSLDALAVPLLTRRVLLVLEHLLVLLLAERRRADEDPAIEPVEVLVREDLEARRVSLEADARRPAEEEVPQAEPTLAVALLDLGFVREPVLVPLLDRDRVVDADVLER